MALIALVNGGLGRLCKARSPRHGMLPSRGQESLAERPVNRRPLGQSRARSDGLGDQATQQVSSIHDAHQGAIGVGHGEDLVVVP